MMLSGRKRSAKSSCLVIHDKYTYSLKVLTQCSTQALKETNDSRGDGDVTGMYRQPITECFAVISWMRFLNIPSRCHICDPSEQVNVHRKCGRIATASEGHLPARNLLRKIFWEGYLFRNLFSKHTAMIASFRTFG
jgi:hypothetical protein